MRTPIRWLIIATLSMFVATVVETQAAVRWNVNFEDGTREGLQNDPARLMLSADAGPSTIYPFPRSGQIRSAPWALSSPPAVLTLTMPAYIPAGTQVKLHLRTRSSAGWQPWDEVQIDTPIRLTNAASSVQLRVVLLSTNNLSPIVDSISGVFEGDFIAAASSSAAPTYRIYATRQGLVGRRTANGHRIVARDRFVALPSWRVLNDRGAHDYMVRITYKGRSAVLPVWDVGPWNTRDDYWSLHREMWRDLPLGLPEAQAAFQQGYNRGRDQFGRRPNLPNGIDIADGAFWDDLGLRDHAWVDVTFLWMEEPAPSTAGGDTTPPVAAITRAVRLRAGHYFMRWSGTDNGGGAVRFDVQVRLTPAGAWTTWLVNEQAMEGLYKSYADYPTAVFRVRARDTYGNVGDYSAAVSLGGP